jgi:hypothetical protein
MSQKTLAASIGAAIVAGIEIAKAFGAPITDAQQGVIVGAAAGLIIDLGDIAAAVGAYFRRSRPAAKQ